MDIVVKRFDSIQEISIYTAAILVNAGETGSAALSCGSTYKTIFRQWNGLFSAHPALKKKPLPAFFPADERLVPFGSLDSNWGVIWDLFLKDHGSREDRGRFASDAAAFKNSINRFFGTDTPLFSVIFLGIGSDGHTASLFPGSCPEKDSPEWEETILETTAPFSPPHRVTLGPGVIAAAEKVVIVITGENKSSVAEKLLERNETLPPVKIITRREELGLETEILLDAEAADAITPSLTESYT